MFTQPGSDAWFKEGLGNSAFKDKIYMGLPLEYYLPGINATRLYFDVVQRRLVPPAPRRYQARFYQLHDAYLMFYQDPALVLGSIKRNPSRARAWWLLVKGAVSSRDYMVLNELTRGSLDLAALAGARWLARVLSGLADKVKAAGKTVAPLSEGEAEALAGAGVREALRAVREYSEAVEGAVEALRALDPSSSYSHEAISVLSFLRSPDAFRLRVRIVRMAAIAYRSLLQAVPASLAHQQAASRYGGYSGVARMMWEEQLRDLHPTELAILRAPGVPESAARAYLAARILQKQATVLERSATVKPVVFVDRSGSMADQMADGVPKISAAAGLALALHRKLNAEIYLYDTEVTRVHPREVVNTLLTITAEGGTNIAGVLREIQRIGRKDQLYIIVTDAIDEVDEQTIRATREKGLTGRIRFILTPPAWTRPWLRNFKHYKAQDIASFTAATRSILTN